MAVDVVAERPPRPSHSGSLLGEHDMRILREVAAEVTGTALSQCQFLRYGDTNPKSLMMWLIISPLM
jgi:hypothetical protein